MCARSPVASTAAGEDDPHSLEKIAFARDALMRFVGVLYSILTLAVAWKLFDHFENATGHKPTNCRVYGNKVSDLEFVGRHPFLAFAGRITAGRSTYSNASRWKRIALLHENVYRRSRSWREIQ